MKIPNKPTTSRFTDDQWQAIYQTNSNVLISAGAGSGKTSVLTERVLRILKEGIDIDKLLVLTFTRAASLEMKERIRSLLIRESMKTGDAHIKHQLALIDVAFITTFDSFCLYLVKKNNHLLNVTKTISIGDDALFKMKKIEIIQSIFNDYYQRNDPAFKHYLNTYTTKSDEKLEDQILFLYEEMIKQNLDDSFVLDYFDTYMTSTYYEQLYFDIEAQINIYKTLLSRIKDQLNMIALDSESGLETIQVFNLRLDQFLALEGLDAYVSYANGFESFKVINKTTRNDRALLKPYTDEIKKIFDKIFLFTSESKENIKHSIELTKPHIALLLEITTKFNQLFRAYQDSIGLYDFSTISSMANHLITHFKEVRDSLRDHYHEILIDEFQDTSLIQNVFVDAIGNNNVFMVGDIKQSIYRFRDAKPELFQLKYDQFKTNQTKGIKIDLNQNFRSRKEVLDDINSLFKVITDSYIGGVDYDDKQQLKSGNLTFEKIKHNQRYGIELLKINNQEIQDAADAYQMDQNLESPDLSSDEIQISAIFKDIKEKIRDGYQVIDQKSNSLRLAQFDDFVILIDRKASFKLFKTIGLHHEIPVYIHASEPFFNNDDILCLRNILSLIYCFKDFAYAKKYFKHAFMSTFRSYVFMVNDNDLHNAILNMNETNHIYDYKKYTSNQTIIDALEQIKSLRYQLKDLTLYDLVIKVVKTFNLQEKALVLDNVEQINNRLYYMIDKTKDLSDINFGLKELLDYFKFISDEALDIDYQSQSKLASNMVNVMTIHKSKGLEFNIVYCPMLDKLWKTFASKSSLYFNNHYGIIMPSFDEGLKENITKTLLIQNEIKETISEKIRLLYVALTRAKELAVIVINEPNNEKFTDYEKKDSVIDKSIRLQYKSYNAVIYSAIGNLANKIKVVTYDDKIFNHEYKNNKLTKQLSIESENDFIYKQLTKSTETNKHKRYSKTNISIKSKNDLEYIALGTKLHETIESLDFKLDLTSSLKTLNLEPNMNSILKQLSNLPIYEGIQTASIFKEYHFVYTADNQIRQGIIDLLIEYENHVIVIDYKLNDISDKSYFEQLSGYMAYVKSKTNKPVKGYLYSIIQGLYTEVK
ncbi:MAG TPA: UvrD-helicase domain-containing protein [Acholeplasma sp.]|nr:UvrD-helicase domain-containing protein [Acholeplasma sp.]